MKIVIPGGTGQVGRMLCRAMVRAGHEVVLLSRSAPPSPSPAGIAPANPAPATEAPVGSVRTVGWDAGYGGDGIATGPGTWAAEIDGADVVINLAGRSVNCRYGAANRRAIMDSRVLSTRAVGRAIAAAKHPPRVWLQASTATIYAHRYDAPHDEATGILGGTEPDAPDTWRFSIDVARAWEEACLAVPTPATRKVLLRSAMTMSPDAGGVFDVLLRLVRFRLGGTCGDGRQFVSWVHEHDFTAAVEWLIAHDEVDGPVNICSPNPVTNREFMATLRRAWGVWLGLPAARWMLAVGAFLMRTETELVLKSRRVVPGRLTAAGFAFRFPTWESAATDLCTRRRAGER